MDLLEWGMAQKPKRTTDRKTRKAKKADAKNLAPAKTRRGPSNPEIPLMLDSPEISGLVRLLKASDGAPIGAYREPLSGKPVLVACLPLAAIEPTPFQRDLSPTHTRRLAERIGQSGYFLDPLIAIPAAGRWWTPNGRHRLAAAKVLGLKHVTVLAAADDALAFRILALNTEKAHNLRDRSLEVIRMARELNGGIRGQKRGILARTSSRRNWSRWASSIQRTSVLAAVPTSHSCGKWTGSSIAR